MARYDEDLHENVFFQTLASKHPSTFSEAAENRWMVSTQTNYMLTHLSTNVKAPHQPNFPRYVSLGPTPWLG